jgi:hypothetical protein
MLTESIHTSKRINEFVNVYFQFIILYLLYDKLYEVDDEKLPSYQIAVIVIFLTTLSPFSISYSALLKILYAQDRYERRNT